MNLRWIVVCAPAVMALAGVGNAWGQSLEDAMAAAYATNPTLAAKRAALRATDEGVPQALSNWRPEVSMSGSVGMSAVRNFAYSPPARGQHRETDSVSLSVEQPLFRGFRTVAATRKAQNTVVAERARLSTTEQTVLLDVVGAYVNVVRDQAVLELNINNEQVLRRQLEATRDRFEVGEVTRTDVNQAEARLAGATAERVSAEGALDVSRAAFANVVGMAPGNLSPPAVPADLPATIDEAVAVAVERNPAVVAADYDERAARDNVTGVRGELLPSVSLTGSAGRSHNASAEHIRLDTYSATLSLSVPLYQQGAVYSRLRSAKQSVAQYRETLDQARRDAIETATSAWESTNTARAKIESFEAQVKAADVALEGVKKEAQVGSRTVLDVLDAEQELLDSKVNLVKARRDLIVAIFTLKSATGQLLAQNLNLSVDYYDPKQHYFEVRDRWFGGSSSGDFVSTGP